MALRVTFFTGLICRKIWYSFKPKRGTVSGITKGGNGSLVACYQDAQITCNILNNSENPVTTTKSNYRKSSIRSRPLIEVYLFWRSGNRGVCTSPNFWQKFESFKITLFGPLWTGWNKKNCSRNYNFWNTSNTSLGNLGFKIIQGRLLIEDLL